MNKTRISGEQEYHQMTTFDENHSSQLKQLLVSSVDTMVTHKTYINNPIHESVLKSDLDTLRSLLKTDCSQVNAIDTLGNTALHYAVTHDNDKFIKLLLTQPLIDINVRNRENRTPLHMALEKPNMNAIQALVQRKDIQLDTSEDREDLTCRKILIQKHPTLATKLLGLKPRELLDAFESKQVDKFVQILESGKDRNADYIYPFAQPGTLLDIVCRSPRKGQFVKILLERGARVNSINQHTGKAAIHEAVQSSDAETVRILRQYDQCHVNILDQLGNSALHYAVRRNNVEIIEILLQNPYYDDGNTRKNQSSPLQNHLAIDIGDGTRLTTQQTSPEPHFLIDINTINQLNQTPLHLALIEHKPQAINILLDQPDIDLDVQRDLDGRNCRQIITDEFPELRPQLHQIPLKSDRIENLFSLLHRNDTDSFIERIQSSKPSSTITDGKYTYLQYACKYGLTEVARALLGTGISPNVYSSTNKHTPAMIASHEGYHEILLMLLNHPDISFEPIESRTVLHSVMTGMLEMGDYDSIQQLASNSNRNHYQCLQYILDQVIQSGKLDINYADENGGTALHMAVLLNDYQVLKDLLDRGADLCQKNNSGLEPLRSMNPSILRQYLDSCISSESRSLRTNYKIIFNYTALIPPITSKTLEIETLSVISDEKDFRPLLQHPILRSFLELKWQALKIYTYINLAFYAIFWLTLNLYFFHYFTDYQRNSSDDRVEFHHAILHHLAYCWCGILVLRELYQYLLSPKLYLRTLINYLEIALILIIFVFLTFQMEISPTQAKILASLAISFSSLELITLVGRLPMFSSNLTMVTSISTSCLKFIAWYLILLLGLAFASNILDTIDDTSSETNSTLDQPATFLYNISVMIMGRVNAPSVADDSSLKLNHFLFLLVIFLAPIVTGIALADIFVVQQQSTLLGIISQVKSIHRIERMVKEDAFGLLQVIDHLVIRVLQPKTQCTTQMFYKRISLADYTRPNYKIGILPNQRNVVLLPNVRKRSWVIDPVIVEEAENILENRDTQNNVLGRAEFENEFQQSRLRFENVESSVKDMEKSIANLISIIESKYK